MSRDNMAQVTTKKASSPQHRVIAAAVATGQTADVQSDKASENTSNSSAPRIYRASKVVDDMPWTR
jgi:hypothetical protein